MTKILFIDDSKMQLQVLRGLIKKDYEVFMSESGLEGIEIAKKQQPDLIFLDYGMPVISGTETLERLRKNEKTKDIPVVFLTGVDDKEEATAALRLKPQGYLLKPVTRDKLVDIIKKITLS